MKRVRSFVGSLLAIATATACAPNSVPAQQRDAFAPITSSVNRELSGERALTTVAFVSQYFRLPGNRGFDASIDTVARLLDAAGFVREDRATQRDRFTYRIESRTMRNAAWEPLAASVTLVGASRPLQQLATNRNMLLINAWPTPPAGVEAEVIDVGTGTDSLFDRVNVKGKIVYGSGSASQLYSRAVVKRGALGILVAQRLPAYLRPDVNRTAIQFGAMPYDSVAKGFGILMSTASQADLRAALARGPVRARVIVNSRSERRPERTLVAEIRGSAAPGERFVYSAHVQEPGANDNASGVGLLAEMARTAARIVQSGVADPQRTITFLWGDEITSTRRFITEDSVRRRGILWGMSLDMVGEATALTGGTFLIEKMPDPSAVWIRGADKHTDWGGRKLAVENIRAYWLNDFVRQRCLAQAARTGWVVKANPFEGGSDHTPFLDAHIPAVLLWHFTDQYYHTDLDRIDKVSAATLANVGNCALSAGLLMTDGSDAVARAALAELQGVAERELAVQLQMSRDTVTLRGADRAAEQRILEAWGDYYAEALAQIPDLIVGKSSIDAEVRTAVNAIKRRTDMVVRGLP